jgi:hypothetical protein
MRIAFIMAFLLLLATGCAAAPATAPSVTTPEYQTTAPPVTFTPPPPDQAEVRLKYESKYAVKKVEDASGVVNVPTVTVTNTDTQRGIFVVVFSVQNPPYDDYKVSKELDLAPGETKTAEWTSMPQEKLGWKYQVQPPLKLN